ncbi:MAG: GIY-YIG nuclease family protein [Mongoliitalea sp.]
MTFFVYIIQSLKDKSYYIGVSSNPEERLLKHNRPHKGYTARNNLGFWFIMNLTNQKQKPSKEKTLSKPRKAGNL